jgi:hypothetical protein
MAEIKEVSEEYNDMMAGFAARASENIPTEPQASIPPTETEVPVTEETPKADAPTAAAPETPKVETPVEDKVESSWSDWDTPEVPKADATAPAVVPNEIFTDLSKALGVEIKTKDDIVAAYKAQAEKTALPDNLPSELKKAIELASQGADYLEYLKVNTVDYGKADPVQLYEDYIIDSMSDKDGNVADPEKLDEYLDSLSDLDKTIRGNEIKRQLISAQAQRTAQLEQEARMSREKHDTELKAALRSMDEVDQFKITDFHRTELFNWISSGKIMQDLFYDANGQFDAVKVSKIAFRNKYHDKLDAYQKTKLRNATKREILKDITNQDITSPKQPANPEPKKGYGIGDYIQSLQDQMNNR